jgi:hypothetical protein
VTALTNTRADVDHGGGDGGKTVVAVQNSLGEKEPKPNQSTLI